MLEKRGRKSRSDLESASIVPLELPNARPEPPEGLSPRAQEAWRNAVSVMPSGWFDAGKQLVLAGYCRHVAAADSIWPQYLAGLEDPNADPKELMQLSKMFSRETDGVRHSSRHLGLLQVGRAYRKVPKYSVTPVMPWEG